MEESNAVPTLEELKRRQSTEEQEQNQRLFGEHREKKQSSVTLVGKGETEV